MPTQSAVAVAPGVDSVGGGTGGGAPVEDTLGSGVATIRLASSKPYFFRNWCNAMRDTRTFQVRSMKSRRS